MSESHIEAIYRDTPNRWVLIRDELTSEKLRRHWPESERLLRLKVIEKLLTPPGVPAVNRKK